MSGDEGWEEYVQLTHLVKLEKKKKKKNQPKSSGQMRHAKPLLEKKLY